MKNNIRITEQFRRRNEIAASVIAADLAKYGGPDSLMGQWADAITTKAAESEPTGDWKLTA